MKTFFEGLLAIVGVCLMFAIQIFVAAIFLYLVLLAFSFLFF